MINKEQAKKLDKLDDIAFSIIATLIVAVTVVFCWPYLLIDKIIDSLHK